MRNKVFIATVAAGCLAFATACGGGQSSGGSAEREAQTGECPPVEEDAIDPEGSFTWMYTANVTSLEPNTITSNNTQMYLYPIYDSLVHIDAAGEPQPMLAKDWEISEDGLSVTMNLIQDWTYHDGTPFDAASVKANIERHKTPGGWNEQALADVTDVEVVDEDTVTLTTMNGAPPLIGVLAGSAGMMMSPAVFDDPNQALAPTGGSGAFTLASYQSGSRVEYTAVDDYWDPDSLHVKSMTYLISEDDNARLNSVITDESDTTFLRASMYEAAQQSGYVVCEAPSLSSYNMPLNTERSEFASKEVRQAINYAIDREAIAAVTDGFCKPGIQMYPDFYYAANDDLSPDKYAHDPEKAKELLKQAGLENGFEFTLEGNNLAIYQQIAEVVQANLQEVGITMNLVPMDLAKLTENFSVSKTSDAHLAEQKAEQDPSIQVQSYLLPGGFMNPGNWQNDEITKLATEALSGKTNEERGEKYAELFQVAHDEASPLITLCHLTTPYVMNDKTMGVEIYADATRQFRGVAKKK